MLLFAACCNFVPRILNRVTVIKNEINDVCFTYMYINFNYNPFSSQSQTRVKVEEAPRYVASENKNQGYASLSGVERGSYSQGQSGYRRYRQGSSVSQGHSGTSQNRNYGYNNYRNNNNQGYSYQRGSHGVRYGVQPGSSNRLVTSYSLCRNNHSTGM